MIKASKGTRVSAELLDVAWRHQAACRGPSQAIFFPPTRLERRRDKRKREQRAKEICAECPVQLPCRNYAVRIKEAHGIWGGLTENERRDLTLTRAS